MKALRLPVLADITREFGNKVASLIFPLGLLLCSGCYQPGGGGTTHIPPKKIESNQATELSLTFTVWGAGSGRLDHRYTDVFCFYRVNGCEFIRLAGSVVGSDDQDMVMKFVIPALDLKAGDVVEYRFEMLFDGQKNVRHGGTLRAE